MNSTEGLFQSHQKAGEVLGSCPPFKLLIWSPGGAGVHYHGPAISIYRLFEAVEARHLVEIHLVHGSSAQKSQDIFCEITALPYIDEPVNSIVGVYRKICFLRDAEKWVQANAFKFDAMFLPTCDILTLPAALTARHLGLPVIGRIAASNSELRKDKGIRHLLGWLNRRIQYMAKLNYIIAISREIEQKLVGFGLPSKKIIYLPNSADTERFRLASAKEKEAARIRFTIPSTAQHVVVCVGAISRRKGQHLLVNAMTMLPNNIHLLLVGPIREQDIFDEMKSVFNKEEKRLTWCNHIKDIEQAYFASDIFVLPSSNEGMPNAMVEAMASGLACIGTPISGITDLLGNNERGQLVKRSKNAVFKAIDYYLKNPDLAKKHGDAARSFIAEKQSRSVTADSIFSLLKKAVVEEQEANHSC